MQPLKDAAFKMRHGYSLNIEAEFMQLDRHKLEHLILKHVWKTPKSQNNYVVNLPEINN